MLIIFVRVTVIANLITSIMMYVPGVGPIYHSMFSIPNVMLTNIMACYVYRNTKLGIIRDPSTLTFQSNLAQVTDSSGDRETSQWVDLRTSQLANGEDAWKILEGVHMIKTSNGSMV